MLKTGTTAVLDHIWTIEGVASKYLDAAMQAYNDAGIRAAVAPSIEDQDLVLEAGAKRGKAFLSRVGVLRQGTSLAHAIWLEQGDLELLASTATTVVHNPVSNLRLGSGRFPLVEARRLGVTVALGSDGSAGNDTQSMFGVLKLAGLIHNQPDEDYQRWPSPMEILEAATYGGASALGMAADLGEIAPGRLADLVLVDLESHPFFPLRDPYLHLVYCENGESIDTVIVDGTLTHRVR